jgi:hypothetical protein
MEQTMRIPAKKAEGKLFYYLCISLTTDNDYVLPKVLQSGGVVLPFRDRGLAA